MKYIFLLILIALEVMASNIKAPVKAFNSDEGRVTISIDKIDVGVSGFVVHHINKDHSSILKSVVVESFDPSTKSATLKVSEFNALENSALPSGKWSIAPGDIVELAFGYSRGLLLAPSEEIYHKITKSVKIEWIHPDLFAMTLSFEGHPTPLSEDFARFADSMSVGLLFIYLDKRVYTVDIKSFKILNITEAPFQQESTKLPFYSRVEEIDAAWWGEGSDEMQEYAPHYYELLVEHNPKNEQLYKIIESTKSEQLKDLLDEFQVGK